MTAYGYLYVGPVEHNADYQRDLLGRQSVAKIFEDVPTSTSATRRPGLGILLDLLQPGDHLVTWRLDRLGASSASIISLLNLLHGRGVGVISLTDGIDTLGADGESIGSLLRALSGLERDLTRKRTLERVYAARARGRSGGRPRALSEANRARAVALRDQGASIREIAEELGTSRATIYRALEEVE